MWSTGNYRNSATRKRRRQAANPRRFRRTLFEPLENRWLLSGEPVILDDGSVVIPLDDVFDQFGFQPAVFQAYDATPGNGFDDALAGFSIFDTGASVVTFGANDQLIFGLLGAGGIPVQVECGAVAEAVGGLSLVGHISQRGTVLADGLHVSSLSFDDEGFPLFELAFQDPDTGSVVALLPAGALTGSATLSPVNGAYTGDFLAFSTGSLRGEVRRITGYDGASRGFSFASPFSNEPAIGDTFAVVTNVLPFVNETAQGSVFDSAPAANRFGGDSALVPNDNHYQGMYLEFTSGPLAGEMQQIAEYTGLTRTFQFAAPFSSAPATTNTFRIVQIFSTPAAIAPDIQAFIGTFPGAPPEGCSEPASPTLPTIAGTPMLNPSDRHPLGLAANIRPFGTFLDFSGFEGFGNIVIPIPDVSFQDPGQGIPDDPACLVGEGETLRSVCTETPMRIPLQFLGTVTDDSGKLTEAYNPVQEHVTVRHTRSDNGQLVELSDQVFLFDTGAQLSVITPDMAEAFGLDLSSPEDTISVQTAGGNISDLPGYRIDSITVPMEGGKTLTFENVWVFVVNAAEGLLDGIMGMNLFNLASSMVYDPWHPDGPVLELRYFTENLFSSGFAQVLEVEPNDVAESATPLRPGEYGAGTLSSADIVDFWASPGTTEGDLIFAFVDTQASTPNNDATLVIRDKNGNILATDDNDGPGPMPVVAGLVVATGLSGTIFHEVQGAAPGSIGEYAIYTAVVDPIDVVDEQETGTGLNDSPGTATPISRGMMTGTLGSAPGSGDVDYYEVTAVEGARIVVMMDNDPDKNGTFTATSVSLIDPQGNEIFPPTSGNADGNAVAAGAVIGAPLSGRYLVRISSGAAGTDTDYRFVTLVIDDGLALLAGNLIQTAEQKQVEAEELEQEFNAAIEACGSDAFCLADTITAYFNQLLEAAEDIVRAQAVLEFASTLTVGTMPTFVDVGVDLRVEIGEDAISENGGTTTAVVRRSDAAGNLVVTLSSSDPSKATVPTTVVIPDGERVSPPIVINAVDNTILDGTQILTVTATAIGHEPGQATLEISDFETLIVAIDADSISEVGGATTATVTRTDTAGALTVFLASSDTTEAIVPVSVVIPAGSATTTFAINAVDDALVDGTRTVTINATAAGHQSGSDTVDVTDFEQRPPSVAKVQVAGPWNVGFPAQPIPTGSGALQLRTLPWTTIDRIIVQFDEHVVVDINDMTVTGVNVPTYSINGFNYDAVNFTATWTLSAPIVKDKLRIRLNADGASPIVDAGGNQLDAEWDNPVDPSDPSSDTYPSGDGTPGRDFSFRINVLPGDASGDGAVNVFDTLLTRLQIGKTWLDADFDPRRDANADGAINVFDTLLERLRIGNTLPTDEPAMLLSASHSPFEQPLVDLLFEQVGKETAHAETAVPTLDHDEKGGQLGMQPTAIVVWGPLPTDSPIVPRSRKEPIGEFALAVDSALAEDFGDGSCHLEATSYSLYKLRSRLKTPRS